MITAPLKLAFWNPQAGLTTIYAILRASSNVVIVSASSGGPDVGSVQPLSAATVPLAAIFLSDSGTPHHYFATVPSTVPSGNYSVEYYLMAGATPAMSDTLQSEKPIAYAAANGISVASLTGEVTTMLGNNTLDMELTPADLQKCLTDAIRVLNREHPPAAWGTVNALTNTGPNTQIQRYALPYPGIYGVVDVDWYGVTGGFGVSMNPFVVNSMSANGYAFGTYMYGQLGDMLQDMTYRDQMLDIRGRKPDWDTRWINVNGTPTLYLLLSDMPRQGQYVMFEYIWHLTPDDSAQTGVSFIPPNDMDWVVNYTLARAKQILGRVLRKFNGGINMPDGSTEQLDGEALMQEGLNSQTELLEEMRQRRRRILPHVG